MEWLLAVVCGLMCSGFLIEEVGYREPQTEPDNAIVIPIAVLSVGLFLFSGIGSAILLKDYMKQHKVRDERKEEGEEEEEGMTEVGVEAATDSVYTALEHGTSSIYNVLDQSDDTDQKRVEQQATNETCVMQNPQTEDGVFESVYENF
ncbi:hypothetical protein SKAU_G00121360 [Synaphobranchus kaupii]|uniref:Uncharacterized protein n=1 Tax=Synaphobranchus kaupii TaxID=118154 RepID=A0A9Q1J2J9_SYNKA|nr:hypothetical protein SKAU_G00121360 [Synaphobranchus kaupii]